VIYLGADVPTQELVVASRTLELDALCLSATSANGLASLVRASRVLLTNTHIRLFVGGPATSYSGNEVVGIRLPPSMKDAASLIIEKLS
jgi:hypothetical protein